MARPTLDKHPKFLRLIHALRHVESAVAPAVLARGVLESLWSIAYESGNPTLGTAADVEMMVGWTGDVGALAEALTAAGGNGHAGFLEQTDSGLAIHDLLDHAPVYVAKRMEREAERQARGVTLSTLRAEAGRKGAAVVHAEPTNGKHNAPVACFDRFWEAYPRKIGKGSAERAWGRIKPDEQLLAAMLAAIAAQRPQWTEPKFTPHPTTWLNGKRWLDEVDEDPEAASRRLTQRAAAAIEARRQQGAR